MHFEHLNEIACFLLSLQNLHQYFVAIKVPYIIVLVFKHLTNSYQKSDLKIKISPNTD